MNWWAGGFPSHDPRRPAPARPGVRGWGWNIRTYCAGKTLCEKNTVRFSIQARITSYDGYRKLRKIRNNAFKRGYGDRRNARRCIAALLDDVGPGTIEPWRFAARSGSCRAPISSASGRCSIQAGAGSQRARCERTLWYWCAFVRKKRKHIICSGICSHTFDSAGVRAKYTMRSRWGIMVEQHILKVYTTETP